MRDELTLFADRKFAIDLVLGDVMLSIGEPSRKSKMLAFDKVMKLERVGGDVIINDRVTVGNARFVFVLSESSNDKMKEILG